MALKADVFYEAVGEDLLAFLQESGLSDALRQALNIALLYDGKVLSARPRSRWPLMVLLPCWGAGTDWRKALPAATAAELLGIATDVFDEIEDGDRCPLSLALGTPRAVNAAATLLTLALRGLSRLPASVSAPLWQALLTAAGGQHQELGGLAPAAAGEYLALADRKSAGLISALCSMGALAGGCAPEMVAGYARFGLHLGRYAQLLNDLHDLWPGVDGKSDLQRRLVTLPVIFVLRGQDVATRERFQQHLSSDHPLSVAEEQPLREALWASGALHFTWLTAETNRRAAETALREVCPPEKADTIVELLLPPVPDLEQSLTPS